MDWLKALAPTLASAIAGPFAPLAYELVSKVIGGTSDDAKKMIDEGKLSNDQITQIKLAEDQIKARQQELGLDFERLAVDDRNGARKMQSETKSKVPPVLAILVTAGFFGILIGLMTSTIAQSNELLVMLGSLGTAWISIVNFYFGSSNGSQAKDQLIYNSTPIKGAT